MTEQQMIAIAKQAGLQSPEKMSAWPLVRLAMELVEGEARRFYRDLENNAQAMLGRLTHEGCAAENCGLRGDELRKRTMDALEIRLPEGGDYAHTRPRGGPRSRIRRGEKHGRRRTDK